MDIETRTQEIRESQAHLPAHQRQTEWKIKADLQCGEEGHPNFVDGRCVRCRTYEPEYFVATGTTEAPQAEPKRPAGCDGSCGYDMSGICAC